MIYRVEYSLGAAEELLRISGVVGAVAAIQAADAIRHRLESDPVGNGTFLSEGLYYIDEGRLRAFFQIDVEGMVVEVTDFRVA